MSSESHLNESLSNFSAHISSSSAPLTAGLSTSSTHILLSGSVANLIPSASSASLPNAMADSHNSIGPNMQASSVKKLKKILGAGTPDILHAKSLTRRYAELLPMATIKGNAQVKMLSAHHASGLQLSSSSMSPSTCITWQPAFLAIVRRTLHIFLLSRAPGSCIPAEITLSLFAFSLEYDNLPVLAAGAQTSFYVATASDSDAIQSAISNSVTSSALPQSSSGLASSATASLQNNDHSSANRSPYIVLRPSVVGGGVHEALALDWDPMAWEYWILIDSDQNAMAWVDCLRQLQMTSSVASSQPTEGSPSASAAPAKSRLARYQKKGDSNRKKAVSKDDLALGNTVESTHGIINDLKRWKMRIGGKGFKLFQPQPSSRFNSGNAADSSTSTSGDSSGTAGNASGAAGGIGGGTAGKPSVFLASCEPSTTNQYVPAVVELCVAVIEARGLDTVGVYRVPGNNAAVTALWESVVVHGIENVDAEDTRWSDIHVVGSLLKSFFRKLSEPLFPYNVYGMLMSANRQANSEKRMLSLKRLIHQLPPHHYETLRVLAKHLQAVADSSASNKMDVGNLAIVFGPTLIRSHMQSQPSAATLNVAAASGDSGPNSVSTAMNELVKDTSDQCRIIQTIIKHVDWFFAGWEADSQVPTDDAPPESQQQAFNHLNATVGAITQQPSVSPAQSGSDQLSRNRNTSLSTSAQVSTSASSSVASQSPAGPVAASQQSVSNLAQQSSPSSASPRSGSSAPSPKDQVGNLSLAERYLGQRWASQHKSGVSLPQQSTLPNYSSANAPAGVATTIASSAVQAASADHLVRSTPEARQEWQRRYADGFYAATLTYIQPDSSTAAVEQGVQQPPTPPTSTHIHPPRRTNLASHQSQAAQQTSYLPSPLILVRSMSLDSIDVLPPYAGADCRDATLMQGSSPRSSQRFEKPAASAFAPITTAKSDAQLYDPTLMQKPAKNSDPLKRLSQLGSYLGKLATAESISIQEAQQIGNERLRLQAEYDQLRARLQSQGAADSSATSVFQQQSQARF